MAFVYDGGPYVDNSVTLGAGTERVDYMNGMKTALTAAGWSSTDVYATNTLTFSATIPSNNTVVVFAGKSYTFQTVLTNVDGNVLIGAGSAAACLNLFRAITLGAGAGTLYATATTANTFCTATNPSSLVIDCVAIGATVFTNLANTCSADAGTFATWAKSTMRPASFRFLSPENPDDFGQFTITASVDSTAVLNNITISTGNRDNSSFTTSNGVANIGGNASNAPGLSTGNVIRFIASPSTFATFIPGVYGPDGTSYFFNAPAIPAFIRGKKIVSATNTSPVVITTTAAHGYTTGQSVVVKYVSGNSGALGSFVITVLTSTSFSLNGSVGTGAGVGGLVWNLTLGEVGECAVGNGCATSGVKNTWRTAIDTLTNTTNYYVFNGTTYSGTGAGRARIAYLALGAYEADYAANRWNNNAGFCTEPWVGVGINMSSDPLMVGQMRNVAYGQVAVPGDDIPPTFDGHSWIGVTNNYSGTGTQAPGTLYWVTG